MKKGMSYSEAIKEIELIVHEIERETIEIDTLSSKVKRAVELIKDCKRKLRKTEAELNNVLVEFEQDDKEGEKVAEKAPQEKPQRQTKKSTPNSSLFKFDDSD